MTSFIVRYFAAASEAAGLEEEPWTLPEASIDALRAALEGRGELMQRVLATGSFLVDGRVSRGGPIPEGATVDVLPPFAGG